MGALNFPVIYRTDESVDQVEAILSALCEGRWQVELETEAEIEDTATVTDRMNMRILFERESDIRALCQPRAA